MFRNLPTVLCLAASITLGAVSAHAQINLVADGDFAADTAYAAPSAPWTSSGGVFIDNTFTCCGATQDAALPDGGLLSQALSTVAGQGYTLDFWAVDEAGDPGNTLTVNLGTFSATITGDETLSGYTEFTYAVSGADILGGDTLSFAATNEDFVDWNIDDVSVVPEPSSMALLLAGIAGLGGLRRRRGF